MHIFHVIVGLNNGGAESFLFRLVQQQIRTSKTVTVVSLTGLGSMGHRFIDSGVNVVCLDLQGLTDFFKVALRLRKLFVVHRPSIVQSWMYHSDFISSIALLGLGISHIWSVRCTDIPKGSILTYFLMRCCAAISHFMPDKICYVAQSAMLSHHKNGYSKSKSVVISNGYDFSVFKVNHQARRDIRSKLDISDDSILFGVLGRFHHDKGQDLLLDALKTLNLSEFKLALIGTGCSYDNPALVEHINKLGFSSNVQLLGNQDNVIDYLSALDVYIMPSRTEGFPNALAEAMAISLPCIATRVGDAELLSNGNAILCDPAIESIAQAIEKVLSLSEIERRALGNSASAYVKSTFSIVSVENQYSKLYSNTVESK